MVRLALVLCAFAASSYADYRSEEVYGEGIGPTRNSAMIDAQAEVNKECRRMGGFAVNLGIESCTYGGAGVHRCTASAICKIPN